MLWEKLDLGGHSLPTVHALCNCNEVANLAYELGASAYPETDSFQYEYAERLKTSWKKANRIVVGYGGAKRLSNLHNMRNKIVHATSRTRAERQNPDAYRLPRRREAVRATTVVRYAVSHYSGALNSTSFDWRGAQEMYEDQAGFLWDEAVLNITK